MSDAVAHSPLLPPSQTRLEAALANASHLPLQPERIAMLWDADACPADLLPWLAWALHVEHWDAAVTEAQQRAAIRASVLLHRKKGTPWAVRQALATMGLQAEVIDQQMQRRAYAAYSPSRLDGSWQLDGSRQIASLALASGIAYIDHWAQFIVRLNLASVTHPATLARLRQLVDEAKPQRSWPIYAYWLRWGFAVSVRVRARFVLQQRSLVPIWPGLYVTSRRQLVQPLGTTGEPLRLDGSWQVGGAAQIGRRYGAQPGPTLHNARVAARAVLVLRTAVAVRPPQRISPMRTIKTPQPVRLVRTPRQLDGSWQVGTDTRLDGSWSLDGTRRVAPHPMYTAPRLGRFEVRPPVRELPDPAHAGRLVLDGSWQVGGPAQPESRIVITQQTAGPVRAATQSEA